MAEQLGKIERPSADGYQSGKRLLFVPLVLLPATAEPDLQAIIDKYWDQVKSQIAGMEARLGKVKAIFHELSADGGDEGLKSIERMSKGSHGVVKAMLEQGARLEPTEDPETLAEFADWGNCLSLGLQSEKALTLVYQNYTEANKKRNEHIAKRLEEALKPDEIGVMLMREGHQMQFPADVRVFYVAPPALDEMKRWLRDRQVAPDEEIKEPADK